MCIITFDFQSEPGGFKLMSTLQSTAIARLSYAVLAGSFVLSAVLPAHAVSFGPATGGPIPDAIVDNTIPGTLTTTITVVDPRIILSLDAVKLVGLSHTFVGDLELTLTAPNGDDVHLFSRVGVSSSDVDGDNSDLDGGTFYLFVNSGGADFIAAALATGGSDQIPGGTYNRSTAGSPSVPGGQDLDTFSIFAGDPVAGTWTLTINDWVAFDEGRLESWSLDFTLRPAQVPEPGTLALLGLGFAAFGVACRRRLI